MFTEPPWASGPGEILKHGLQLLEEDSDTNRRLAMISIDNAVELMLKTFLGLPKRVTGLQISRSDYQEFSESFPKLLDAVERHASDKIVGIDLGEIEWYHRLRNQLYHQGNGLTVERSKVEVYAKLADTLFLNLFGVRLVADIGRKHDVLGEFIQAWANFERALMEKLGSGGARPLIAPNAIRHLVGLKLISESEAERINEIRKTRNGVVHGVEDYKKVVSRDMAKLLNDLTKRLTS
jgi:hypothetical protein